MVCAEFKAKSLWFFKDSFQFFEKFILQKKYPIFWRNSLSFQKNQYLVKIRAKKSANKKNWYDQLFRSVTKAKRYKNPPCEKSVAKSGHDEIPDPVCRANHPQPSTISSHSSHPKKASSDSCRSHGPEKKRNPTLKLTRGPSNKWINATKPLSNRPRLDESRYRRRDICSSNVKWRKKK